MTRLWRSFRGLPAWVHAVAWVMTLLIATPVWFASVGADPTTGSTVVASLEPAEDTTPTPEPEAAAAGPSVPPTPAPGATARPEPTAVPLPAQVPADAQPGVVERVVDGDTIAVRIDEPGGPLPANASHTVRLLEMDTPETVHPSEPVECWGPEASRFTESRLGVGSTVHLVADAEDTDQYGRFLRYVWTEDGTFFNEAAVREGHARAVLYEPNDAHIDALRTAEAEARAAGRGMWGSSCAAGAAEPGPPPPTRADSAPPPASSGCEPGYEPCVPRYPPDVDCGALDGPIRVPAPDPHHLDGDGDGWGCEAG